MDGVGTAMGMPIPLLPLFSLLLLPPLLPLREGQRQRVRRASPSTAQTQLQVTPACANACASVLPVGVMLIYMLWGFRMKRNVGLKSCTVAILNPIMKVLRCFTPCLTPFPHYLPCSLSLSLVDLDPLPVPSPPHPSPFLLSN